MSGSGSAVGVVVVTVGEIGAAIEKHAEASLTKLVTIAFKIVAAELINHDYDNELGASVVGGCECGRDRAKQQECRAKQQWRRAEGAVESHCELVYRRPRSPRRDSPAPAVQASVARLGFLSSILATQERGGASPRQTAEVGCPYASEAHPRARHTLFQLKLTADARSEFCS